MPKHSGYNGLSLIATALVALCYLVFVPQTHAATGQLTKPTVPTYFRHISVQEGLSQVTVADILQDKHGFMWFATQNGVNRFDGYEFIQYKRDKRLNGSGPIGDYAYKLALDQSSSDIWVATSGGLSRYIYQQDRFRHYPLIGADGENRSIVLTVVFDRTGQMWVGTRQGLFRYDSQSDTFVPLWLDISASAWVLDIEQDTSGELLVATTEGLFAIDLAAPAKVVTMLKGEEVTDIELLSSGEFWIATTGSGVLKKQDGQRLSQGLNPVTALSSLIIKSGVNSIKQLRNGDIWISANAGLSIVDYSNEIVSVDITKTNDASSLLSSAHMTRTYESDSGLVWQGTWTSGFSLYDPDSQLVGSFTMLPGRWIRGLEKDADDNVWFGAPNGIWQRKRDGSITGPWLFPSQLNPSEAEKQRYIRSLAYDQEKDRFWVGTTSGLFILRKQSKVLQTVDALSDTNIFFIDTDPDGHLWVGTFNQGLYWLDAETQAVKGHWAVATVTHLYVNAKATVYAGTIEGLILIDKRSKAFVYLNDESRPDAQRSPRVVTWISKAQDGGYLLGTQGSGIFRMHVDQQILTFEAVHPESHLATLSIGGVEEDKSGNIWASTTEGLAKIDNATQTISYFNKRNGAYSEGYYINHSLQLESGEIIFAGPKGMSFLFPEKIRLSDFTPNVVTTKLLVLNEVVTPMLKSAGEKRLERPIFIADMITLGPDDNVISVEFSALDYSAPENNQYQYRLKGFDKDWNYSDAKHRVATYTNLDPGRYELVIKGTNKDGIWSDNVRTLQIVVEPPWFWNTWTKLLWSIMIIGLFTSLYRWRTWSLKKRSEELSKLVKQRTYELEQSNLKLTELSTMDELTQLRNRRGFRELAESELEKFKRTGKAFSILMFDMDHFKEVNDKRGHAAGDRVLAETAAKIKSMIRAQDHIARWGGEEFIILAVETPLESAVTLAEKIREQIEQNTISFKDQKIQITVTIGISEIRPEQSLDQCINAADKLLYQGKHGGRNQVRY